jgi:adenylate cyclase
LLFYKFPSIPLPFLLPFIRSNSGIDLVRCICYGYSQLLDGSYRPVFLNILLPLKWPVFLSGLTGEKMVINAHPSIRIDLNEFKIHIDLKKGSELTLHFNSPSRMFYLSVIALVVNEMKQLGKITSIPLEKHLDLLVLLNESVGGSAGSSDKKNLLTRIYKKWKNALPNLEEAPLYKVLGRKKEYDEWIGKTYLLTETEKDSWANLFEYKGSEENVRLKFSIDKIGASLDDVVIVYEDALDGDAWDRFLSSLKGQDISVPQQVASTPEMEAVQSLAEVPVAPVSPIRKLGQSRQFWVVVVTMIVLIVGVAAMAIWKLHLRPASVNVASVEKMAFPLPDKPSIAVLPFTNMSNDPQQEFFSDGLTEEIITALGKVPKLFVIARNSTFAYKGKPVKVQQVSEELGVRYVLEGSVRKDGNNIRIAAQLIDALTGNHIWAERYDRNLKDIFAVQDEITKKIITAMQVKLTDGEQAQAQSMGTKNLEAYLKFLQSRELTTRNNPESNALAKQLAEESIGLDPMYASAYQTLAYAHQMDVWLGTSKSPKDSIAKAIELLQKAITLDDTYAAAHGLLGWLFSMTGQHDKAVAEGEKAVALNPNSAESHVWFGGVLRFAGRYEESIPELKTAIRLNPIPPNSYLYSLGVSCALTGHLDEAIAWCEKAVRREPNSLFAHLFMAMIYSQAGRDAEARIEAAEVLRINPKFSLEKFAKSVKYKKQEDVEWSVSAPLRKAGLK